MNKNAKRTYALGVANIVMGLSVLLTSAPDVFALVGGFTGAGLIWVQRQLDRKAARTMALPDLRKVQR